MCIRKVVKIIPQYLKDLETNWPRLVPKYMRLRTYTAVGEGSERSRRGSFY